jgi:peptidoglycan/LPS O-acetylase OafA/YrhL
MHANTILNNVIVLGIISFVLSGLNIYYGIFNINRVILFGIPSFMIIYGLVSLEVNQKIKNIPKVLIFLGDASYSIYLIHYPLLSMANKVFNSLKVYDILGNFVSCSIITIGIVTICCLFYMIIEKPLLSNINRFVIKRRQIVKVKVLQEIIK